MPRIDTASCPQLLRFVFPKYYPRVFSWRNQLEIAANLAGAIAALHEAKYVVGDLNLKNIHVTRSCLVTSVDCDSFQVPDPVAGRILRCPVGVPEYTAPEFQGQNFSEVDRTASSDVFAFAVILCQLLLAGTHPFAGGGSQTREENVGVGDSIFHRSLLPRGSPPLGLLPPQLLRLLETCFRDGHRDPSRRPTMREYAEVLQKARAETVICKAEPDHHTYGIHLGDCPWCELASQYGFDPYRKAPPKPKPQPRAPVSQTVVESVTTGLFRHYRRALRLYRLRKAIVSTVLALALVIAVSVAWNALETRLPSEGASVVKIGSSRIDIFGGLRRTRAWIRERADDLWNRVASSSSKPASIETAAQPASAVLSPPFSVDTPFLCYGLDAVGMPIPARNPVREVDAAGRTLNVYVRFRNATPGKTSLQVRWLIAGRQNLFSSPFTPESSDGAILVPYRGRLPEGSCQVTVLGDGITRASLDFPVIESPRREGAKTVIPRPLQPRTAGSPLPLTVRPAAPVEPPAVIMLQPAGPHQRTFKARHKHTIGTCNGELILEAERMIFVSPAHLLRWARGEVTLHEDGIEDTMGRKWHFVVEGQDVHELLSRWLRKEH